MVPNPSTTSLLDSMKIIEVLKNLILDQVRLVHGRSYSTPHYTFSVTTSIFNSGRGRVISYYAQAIVYTTPGSLAEWKLLAESEGSKSTQEAVESLYCKVQKQTGEITDGMAEGEVWNEATAAKEAKEAKEMEAEKMAKAKEL